MRQHRDVVERGRPELQSIGTTVAVGDEIEAELAQRVLDPHVTLPDGRLDNAWHLAHGRPTGKTLDRLLHDARRLDDLLYQDPETVEAVAVDADRHVEVHLVVGEVGLVLADVERDAGPTGDRARDAVVVGDLLVQDADAQGAGLEDLVAGQQVLVLLEAIDHLANTLQRLREEALRHVLFQAARAEVTEVEPTAGRHLHRELDVLALAERIEGWGDGAELGPERSEEHQVVDDAVHLDHHHPQIGGPGRDLDLEHLLDREPQRELVRDLGQPVHARHEVRYLPVIARLYQLLLAAMHVTDDRFALDDPLSVDGREKTEHAVGRGVLRPHVEDHLLGLEVPSGDDLLELRGIVHPRLRADAALVDSH